MCGWWLANMRFVCSVCLCIIVDVFAWCSWKSTEVYTAHNIALIVLNVYMLCLWCVHTSCLCRVSNISCNPFRAAAQSSKRQEEKRSLLQGVEDVQRPEKQTRSVCWFANMRFAVVSVCVIVDVVAWSLWKRTDVHRANTYILMFLNVCSCSAMWTHIVLL